MVRRPAIASTPPRTDLGLGVARVRGPHPDDVTGMRSRQTSLEGAARRVQSVKNLPDYSCPWFSGRIVDLGNSGGPGKSTYMRRHYAGEPEEIIVQLMR